MGVVQLVSRIALQCVCDITLIRPLRDAVEEQVAELWVRRELQTRIARDERGLKGEIASGVLQAQRSEVRDFALVLVEVVAAKIRLAVDGQAGTDPGGRHAAQVGYLKVIVGAADEEGDPVGLVEDVLEVAEAMVLLGVIVQRRARAIRRFDPEAVADVVAGDEVRVITRGPAVAEARFNRAVTPTV